MDFGALPPEVNSGRMYSGPGSATMLAASAWWEQLGAEMNAAAGGCEAAVAELVGESWRGPSAAAMTAAVQPYVRWIRATAAQCEEMAAKATAAAGAYEAAHAMTVPPPVIVANRVRLAALVATNLVGQNTPAIMAAEAEYGEMWAQDATAMYGYAANSARASDISSFAPPPGAPHPGAVAANGPTQGGSAGGLAKALGSAAATLQGLAGPGAGGGASTAIGTGAPLLSTGISSSTTSLSRLADISGQSVKTSAHAGMQVASRLASAAAAGVLDVADTTAPEVGSSALGFGTDGFGLSSDISGFALDLAGSGLELVGGDSLLDVEEAVPADLGALGSLDGLTGLDGLADPWSMGWDGQTSAGLGQASALGTLSVPPGWAHALSSNSSDAGNHGAAAHPAHPPMGGMVGHESKGTAHRVGARTSLIPRSPLGG
ncbi:PPE family protein [Mycobacterium sp. 050134]|uniref:PPE family protein n=1 Tax=Mycobacterium sp. 050134 TaxID=3096111 RepID=UPI002ED84F81